MAGSGQNTFSWVKFSKIPSTEAFHQLLQALPLAALGPRKGLQVTRREGSGTGRRGAGRSRASPRSFPLFIMPVPAPVRGRACGAGTLSPPAHGRCQMALSHPAGWPYPDISLPSLSPAPWFCSGSGLCDALAGAWRGNELA